MKSKGRVAKRVLAAAGLVFAAGLMPMAAVYAVDNTNAQAPAARDATATASGEVRRVDKTAGKVALKHDEIAALELPAMTLVYLAEPALLIDIEPGDRVRFTAARRSGQYILLEISK
jgi:Cu(I)/Ag(I) efflux system protein CusF